MTRLKANTCTQEIAPFADLLVVDQLVNEVQNITVILQVICFYMCLTSVLEHFNIYVKELTFQSN